jgi:hypothetical protein
MTHPFEEQFGPGPYHFVAYWEMPSQGLQAANPEAYNNALRGAPRTGEPDALSVRVGACHHCGTGIIHHYILRTPTGRTFIVGSDCVYKIAPKTEVAKRVRDHVRERVNAAQRAKRDLQRAAARKARESAWRREGAAKAREFFKNVCSQYPMDDLKAALRQNRRHTILKDMLDRLMRWGTLSEKQIAFALQLAADLDRPVDVFDSWPRGASAWRARS